MALSLTAVVLAKDASATIKDCLASLTWCPKILVVDDYSTDDTAQIAKSMGANVVTRALNSDFAAQRNFALTQVNTVWTLFVDADETVTPDLAAEIPHTLTNSQVEAYRLHRQDIFIHKLLKHGETARWNQVRLAQTKSGKWSGKVHETWQGHQSIGQLNCSLHHTSSQTLSQFLHKLNHYTTLRAQELHKDYTTSPLEIIFYPSAKFFQNYILFHGLLDGTHGFVHSLLMAFHSFLVRSKLYLLQTSKK